MGSVWRGSGLTLEKNALAMEPEPDTKVFSKKELAAINIAKKVSKYVFRCVYWCCVDLT